jgi:arylsulfatase A-like enzyme
VDPEDRAARVGGRGAGMRPRFGVRAPFRPLAAVSLVCLATVTCSPGGGQPPAPVTATAPARPLNFLVIVVDTLRYDAIVGARAGDAPFLSALAQAGTTFTRSYSTNDSTPASHFSLLSGFVRGFQTPLDDAPVGLPAQLARKGYDTFGVAANGNLTPGVLRLLAGFRKYLCVYDEWEGLSTAARRPQLTAIHRRLDAYHARHEAWNEAALYVSAANVLPHIDAALADMRAPFFGFVNLLEPHDPYLPATCPAASAANVDPDVRYRQLPAFLTNPDTVADAGRRDSIKRRVQQADGRAWSLSDDLSPAAMRAYRDRYQCEVREADAAVQQIVVALERRALLDSTVLIVTSDHGESFGEAGFLTHSLNNEGDREAGQRVPLIVVLPDGPAASVDALVSGADVAPTVYDLAGIDWRPVAQESWVGNFGKSLVPYLGVSVGAGSPAATRTVRPDAATVDVARRRAAERLRALGYIK